MKNIRKFLFNALILCGVSLIMRTVSVSFNVYVSNAAGAEAMGLYSLLSSVYGFALTFASSGINITTVRMVSGAIGCGDAAHARECLRKCILYSLFFSGLATIFLLFGADFIRGTWVQYLFLTLALITVFMGSMLAYREKVLKKRLAYSTVSQLSYILFGIALLNPVGLTGSMLHMIAHAFIKCALFLCAGAIIFQTGITNVDDLKGIGKKMPLTIWCFTIVSLGLIGIPPTGGFISKWYLATGALDSGIAGFQYAGPIILLISALLTAGYLLPVTIKGFFPGDDFDYDKLEKCEPGKWMTVPLVILAVLSVVIGMFPNGLLSYIQTVAAGLM